MNIKKIWVFLNRHRKKVLVIMGVAVFLLILYIVVFIHNKNVIASVGRYKITVEDIIAELESSPEFYKQSVINNPEAAINTYIDQIIIYKEAKKYERKYRHNLKVKMRNYYIKVLSKEFVDNELSKKIKIEESAISQYYNTHLEDFIIPERARIYEIVLPDRQKAEEVLRRLSYGESFEAIAMQESVAESRTKAGDLGWIDIRKLDSEISSMITQINPGDILANIIQTELGYHIIKLAGKTERRVLTLSEATPSIINLLMVKEKKKAIDDLVAAHREKNRIRIFGKKIKLLQEALK